MKINKFLIVSIFLAILTIGAVSASDNLTAESDTVSLADDSSGNILDESYYNGDFYITVDENYTQDKIDWDTKDLIYISSGGSENGTFSVLVDDKEKKTISITNGYFSTEDDGHGGTYNRYVEFIYPADLGLDLGNYNIKVKYNQNTLINSAVCLKEKEDFDIFMQNPYNCDHDYWDSPSFIILDSNHANTGTLEISVNETLKISYAVNNGDFEEIADCSNKSRYIAAGDLLEGYGTYNIKITFAENGVTKTLRNENVIVREFEPTTNPKLDLSFDLYYLVLPADNIAHVYLPREATGNLTISFNNVKNQTVSYSKGHGTYYMHAYDLNHLGENTITVTYKGDDFGTLQTTESIVVVPKIAAPHMVSVGEEFTISAMTHEWVFGKFNVYEYHNGKKGKLLASDSLYQRKYPDWATASVKLASEKVGLNTFYLEFDYPGSEYPLTLEVYVIENTKNVSADVPGNVELGSDVTVTFTAPAVSYNFVYISVDGNNPEFYSLESGKVIKTISGLSTGVHNISVQYNDGNYVDGKLIGDVYSNTFPVIVGKLDTQISAAKISTAYNVAKNLVITLKDVDGNPLSGKNVVVFLNGNSYPKKTNDNGQVILQVKLPAKTYNTSFRFEGDEVYAKSSGSVKVVVSKATPKLTVSAKTFKLKAKTKKVTATLKTNKNAAMKKTKVTLKLNGKTYSAKTNSKGVVPFNVKLTKKGTFKAMYRYSGSSNYKAVSKTVKITVKK